MCTVLVMSENFIQGFKDNMKREKKLIMISAATGRKTCISIYEMMNQREQLREIKMM